MDASEELARQGERIVEIAIDVPRNQIFVGVLGMVDRASDLLSGYVDARAFRIEKVSQPATA